MVEKSISPNPEMGQELLEEYWTEVLQQTENADVSDEIASIIGSPYVSIRFCLPTQLLGKLVDPRLNCLCLQKGNSDDPGAWDPRSFANKVIVPWVARNESVLGTSTDPYVSKPLRKPWLEQNPGNVKGKEHWEKLYNVLSNVEKTNSEEFTAARFRETLLAISQQLSTLRFEYVIPGRVSLSQVEQLISAFLSESSGGDRSVTIAAALFQTIGEFFGIYSEVRRYAINAADSATGTAGDIECLTSEGQIRLVVEVKDRLITLIDVNSAIRKARQYSLKEILFNAPGIAPADEDAVTELFNKTWASGTNVYRLSIEEMLRVSLTLAGEDGCRQFLVNVGNQLDEFGTQPINRQRWKEILDTL